MAGVVRVFSWDFQRRKRSRRERTVRASFVLLALALAAATTFAADTIVFGPRTYNGNGRPILDRRTFRIQNPSGTYVLRVTNRGVIRAFVALNGRMVLLPPDFSVRVETTRFDNGGARNDDARRQQDERRGQNGDRGDQDNERERPSGREEDGWTPEWDRMRRDNSDDDDRPGRGPVPVPLLEREVTLRNGNNNLVVGFRGRRGTSLTIEIVRRDGTTPDTTPPTITATASPAPNASGWWNSDVTVTFSCTDIGGSGVATCPAPSVVSTEGANQTITGTAVDVAGNMASASLTLNIDRTAPVVSASASPGANANGWNNGPVAVTFSATDALSGVALGSLTGPATLVADGANLSASGQATDVAGNVGVFTLAGINIDQVAPTLSAVLPPVPGGSSFYGSPVTVHFVCSDTGSGIAACPADQFFSTDGPNQTATGTVTDLAGNMASATSAAFGIDLMPPTAVVSLSPGPNINGWNSEPVTAHFTCSDAGSGIATCPGDQVLAGDGGNQTVSGTATDNAGNSASVTSAAVNIDTVNPTIAVTLSPGPSAGYVNVPVTAHFECSDLLSGVGSCPSDQVISGEGTGFVATGAVTDLAGNTASVSSPPFSIDMTLPVVTTTLTPAANAAGWNNTPVTIHFTCTDGGAGVAWCPADQLVSQPGANQVVGGTVTDAAGNSATASATINLDPEPPVFTWTSPAPGATLVLPTVTATAMFSDPLSGIASATCNGAPALLSGPALSCDVSLTPGANTIAGTVTDRAGNTTTADLPVTYTAGPHITSFTPTSASVGTLITLTGSNLAPNPRIILNRLGGGTLEAPVATASATSVAFVIPAGAATGVITLAVGTDTTGSASPLTVTASSDFTLEVEPAAVTLVAGQSTSFAVRLGSSNAFAQLAALEVAGIPSGATATFAPPRITAGQTSILTFTVPPGQSEGSTDLTIRASATVDGLPQSENALVQLTIATPTTSLLGRIVVSDALETPLAGVTVTMLGKNGNGGATSCTGSTVSDAAGNFLLNGLGAGCVGPQLVGYDGTTATSPEGEYAGVNLIYTLTSDEATVSPVLVHLPRIDDKETFYVHQNVTVDQSYSYKTIPGLAVTVYRGTTFTLQDGSQPDPFPLVAVQVPVDRLPDAKPPVPTMLSVFIVAFQPANAVASQPAAVFYPNTLNTAPGTNMTLMTLDPTRGRMIPYGTATVSPGGAQIVPDLNPAFPGRRYGIVNFDWHGPMPPPPVQTPNGPNPINPTASGGGCDGTGDACAHGGTCECPIRMGRNPVDVASGLETIVHTDISFGGPRGSISMRRFYRTLSTYAGPFGIGTNHNYGYSLDTVNFQSAVVINLIAPDGNRFPFTKEAFAFVVQQPLGGQPLTGALVALDATNELRNYTNPAMVGAVMTVLPGEVQLRWKDGTVYRFVSPAANFTPLLESVTDSNGNKITVTRGANPNQIAQITDPVGRSLRLAYDGASRITSITDPIGRAVHYTYNSQGTLETVTDPEGGETKYEYDSANRPIKETDPGGVVVAQNTYDAAGRVIAQTQADGGVFHFDYSLFNNTAPTSPVMATVVTDPLGRRTHYRFSPGGFLMQTTSFASGQSYVIRRDALSSHIVLRQPIGTGVGQEAFERDDRGNLLKHVDALGRSTTYTYEATFNKVTSITDALGHTTTFSYDGRGDLTSQTDANGKTTSYKYDASGLLTQATDPLGHSTRFQYDTFGTLVTITDAAGNDTRLRYDGASRLVEVQDFLGRKMLAQYDNLNRVIKQTDAKGQTTTFTYDRDGNLLSLTDARNKTTTFVYDALNRLTTRTDPVGKPDTRSYDSNNNMVSFTDRRGQMSTFVYDELDRLTEEHYSDGSVVSRSYDASGQLVQVTDSGSGSFTFGYDLTESLVSSNGPTGSVKYVRDGLGRVQQRQVVGQPAVDYAYDPVGNLTSASMPQASVTYAYDAANRPSTMTRSNGVRTDYSYDPVGQLLSIVHSRGASSLLSLAYSYDATGQRVSQQSSSAQPLVTQAATATVDDANRLVQRGPISYSYDANGNVTAETGPTGTTTYSWDARNRLSRIVASNGQTTDFTYDFAGNLIRQSDSGPLANVSRSYTLDVLTNVAFEQRSDGDQMSVLTAAAIDSHLATWRPDGQVEYALADGINSTVATFDQSGATKGHFDYEPFGQTTSTGTNFPFEYTARVQVSSGLYNYRARFYQATTGRFISEDPIEFASGDANLYRYGLNQPVLARDPLGHSADFDVPVSDQTPRGYQPREPSSCGPWQPAAAIAFGTCACGWTRQCGTTSGMGWLWNTGITFTWGGAHGTRGNPKSAAGCGCPRPLPKAPQPAPICGEPSAWMPTTWTPR